MGTERYCRWPLQLPGNLDNQSGRQTDRYKVVSTGATCSPQTEGSQDSSKACTRLKRVQQRPQQGSPSQLPSSRHPPAASERLRAPSGPWPLLWAASGPNLPSSQHFSMLQSLAIGNIKLNVSSAKDGLWPDCQYPKGCICTPGREASDCSLALSGSLAPYSIPSLSSGNLNVHWRFAPASW